MKGAPGALHRRLVAEIVESHGASTKGFPQALRAADQCLSRVVTTLKRVIPDAFVVDIAMRTVTVFEVEVHNALDDERLFFYLKTKRMLECRGWSLILIRVDAYGERRPHFSIDTYPWETPRSNW